MRKYLLTSITLIFLWAAALAQAPSNDNCPGSRDLTYANQFSLANQSIASATLSYAGPSGYPDVWYKFTTLRTGNFTIQTTGNTGIVTYVYKLGFGGFNSCSSTQQPTEPTFETAQDNVPGSTTVFVRVVYVSSPAGQSVPFTIKVSGTAVGNAPNDDCPFASGGYGAKDLPYGTWLYNENNYYSTQSPNPVTTCGNSQAGSSDDDTWYRFSVPYDLPLNRATYIEVASISNKDMVVQLYDNCGDLIPLACADYSTGFTEKLVYRLSNTQGFAAYLRVFTFENGAAVASPLNNFDIIVTDTIKSSFDECNNGNGFFSYGGSVKVSTTLGASYSDVVPQASTCITDANGVPKPIGATGIEPDVWHFFSRPTGSTNPMVIRVKATDGFSNPVFFVYKGTDCNNLTQIGCGNASDGTTETLRLRDLGPEVSGTEYYVRIHQFNGQVMPFTIEAKDTIIAVNDVCTGAINIPFGTNLTSQSNTNMTGPIVLQTPCTGPAGTPEDDSWFRFAPTGAIANLRIQTTNNTNPVMVVYSINPAFNCRNGVGGGGITQIACSNTGGVTFETLLLTGLTPNNEYLIRVYDQQQNPMNFSIYAGILPLPVSLSSFTGEHAANINTLRWTTLTEVNNASFELQRSTNGRYFETITSISSKATGGSSNAAINYDYTDRNPAPGINYYRLKQVDKDAKATYSSIVQLKGITGKMFTLLGVYPSPASNAISVNISSPVQQLITLIVTDIAGKIVKQQTTELIAGEKTFSMDVQALGTGSYFIKAICQDGCQSQYLRFNKN